MIALLLTATLLAQEVSLTPLRPRPAPSTKQEDDCARSIPAEVGFTSLCNGVIVPPADLLDLHQDRVRMLYIEERYQQDTAILLKERAVHQMEKQILLDTINQLRKPTPLAERPGLWIGVGTLTGSALAIGLAYSLSGAL